MEHKLIRGGGQYLPFARSRIKAMRATGLTYASQKFVIDGCFVWVTIADDQDYIRLEGGGILALSVPRLGIFNPGIGLLIVDSGPIEGPPLPGTLRQEERTLLSPDGRWAVRFAANTFSFLGVDTDNSSTPKILATEPVPTGYLGGTSAYPGYATGRMTPVYYGEKISGPDPTETASTETMVTTLTIVWVDAKGVKQRRFLVGSALIKYGIWSLVGTKDCVYVLVRKQTFTDPPPFFSSTIFPHTVEFILYSYTTTVDSATVIDSATYPYLLGGALVITPSGGVEVLINRRQNEAFPARTTTLFRKDDGVYVPTVVHNTSPENVVTGVDTPEGFNSPYMDFPPSGLSSGRFTYFIGGTLLVRYPAELGGVERFARRQAAVIPTTTTAAIAGSFYIQGKSAVSTDVINNDGTGVQQSVKVVEVSNSFADSAATHLEYSQLERYPIGAAIVGPRLGFH